MDQGSAIPEGENLAARTVLLDHLERRRSTYDTAMWQAPGLTIAAQAFLLQVLADDGLTRLQRLPVLLAGVSTVLVAAFGFFRLRAREVQYAEAIWHYSQDLMPDVRPPALPVPAARKPRGRVDAFELRAAKYAAAEGLPRGHTLWAIPLLLFALADIVVWWTA